MTDTLNTPALALAFVLGVVAGMVGIAAVWDLHGTRQELAEAQANVTECRALLDRQWERLRGFDATMEQLERREAHDAWERGRR